MLKPNNFTAFLGGIVTAIGGLIANINNENFLLICIAGIAFMGSMFYLVVGVDFLNERFKNYGIRALIFPSSKEDLIVLLRILIWFITAGGMIVACDKLGLI